MVYRGVPVRYRQLHLRGPALRALTQRLPTDVPTLYTGGTSTDTGQSVQYWTVRGRQGLVDRHADDAGQHRQTLDYTGRTPVVGQRQTTIID